MRRPNASDQESINFYGTVKYTQYVNLFLAQKPSTFAAILSPLQGVVKVRHDPPLVDKRWNSDQPDPDGVASFQIGVWADGGRRSNPGRDYSGPSHRQGSIIQADSADHSPVYVRPYSPSVIPRLGIRPMVHVSRERPLRVLYFLLAPGGMSAGSGVWRR